MTAPIYTSQTRKLDSDTPDADVIIERIERCVKDISLDFDRWDDPSARGPGLYFVVEHDSVDGFVGPMGANYWPVADCPSVFDETEALLETAESVALSCDGAIIIGNDGSVMAEMVRVNQPSTTECQRLDDLPYAEWMGTRHMSALETSTRDEVAAAITLSEEDGRVTVFTDGTFDDSQASTLTTDI